MKSPSNEDQAVKGTVTVSDNGLTLEGSLIYATASFVLSNGCSQLARHSSDLIIIDLGKLSKIDTAGISVLLAWKRLCDSKKKKYQIVNAQKQAAFLINTNKLGEILNLN